MGSVDQAYQLRLQYCIHYWLSNCKWWWAIFFWVYELSLTNCYVLYLKFYQIHLRKPPWNHYEFIWSVTLAWIDPKLYWPVKSKKRASSSSVCDTATTSSSRTSKKSKTIRQWNDALSDLSLDPCSGALSAASTHDWLIYQKKRKKEKQVARCNNGWIRVSIKSSS